MEERNYNIIQNEDLNELLKVSSKSLVEYFTCKNLKYIEDYNFQMPFCVALCQGAAKHYLDQITGVKDFDVWFFFDRKNKRLPHRKIINTVFTNGNFSNVRVDILFRDINIDLKKDIEFNLKNYLKCGTKTAKELSKKPLIILSENNKIINYNNG